MIAAGLMVIGGLVEAFLGVSAEQRPLEEIAEPITAQDGEGEEDGAGAEEQPPAFPRYPRRAAWSPFSLTSAEVSDEPLRRREVEAIATAAQTAEPARASPGARRDHRRPTLGSRPLPAGATHRDRRGLVRRTRRGMYESANGARQASSSSPRS